MKTSKQATKTMLKVFIILALLVTIPGLHAFAAPPFPGGDPGAPIDGGLSLLVAAGVGYGIKKVRNSRKAGLKNAEKSDSIV